MGAGRTRFIRGPSLTLASETYSLSTSTSSLRLVALAMADCSTFSTVGAMRLLVVRSVFNAAPACWPRIRSTTSRAFCGEIRMYRASAFASIISSQLTAFALSGLSRLLRGRFHRVALERPRGRKLAQLVSHHVLGDIHRDELLPVVHRNSLSDELRQNCGTARPGAHHFLLIRRNQDGQLGFQVRISERPLL